MSEDAHHQAFESLRPLCVQLTQDHTRGNVNALQRALRTIDSGILQDLQEYVLFPLRLILKSTKNKCREFHTDVVRCMGDILEMTKITKWELFVDLFNSLCIFISSPDPQQRVIDCPEELKLAVVKSLINLVANSSTSVLESMYKPVFLPPLGHAVSLLLHLLETESMRELRLAAIHCLLQLAAVNRKLSSRLKICVGDMFASFLPGITMALTKVATGDPKQGQTITKNAAQAWAKVVVMVMNDETLSKISSNPVDATDLSIQKLVVTRTPEWIKTTSEKLQVLVTRMTPLTNNSNWKVRLAMVEWSSLLLTKCTKSLQCCMSSLLEVLVSRATDDYTSVASASKAALTELQNTSMASENARDLCEVLEENLHSLATRLPRIMRTSDDEMKHSTLCLLNGYLRLLGPQLNRLLQSYSHLNRLSLALLHVLDLDCSGVKIIQEKTPGAPFGNLEQHEKHSRVRKFYKHFTEERVHNDLMLTCRLLGYYGDIDLLTDHFLEKFLQSSLHRKQAASILNEIMIGTTGQGLDVDILRADLKEKAAMENIVRSLLEEYLQPEHWDLPTTGLSNDSAASSSQKQGVSWQIVRRDQPRQQFTVEDINSNIMLNCLMLEGIGNAAKVLEEGFCPLLMDVLYPVLEKLGSESYHVSQTAYLVLEEIARACSYRNIPELIHKNADYLVNSISLKLRHLHSNPKAPLVLKVSVMYSDKDILPLVYDTVLEVLESLDIHYSDKAVHFLTVLHALVSSILRWYPDQQDTESSKLRSQKDLDTTDLKNFFMEKQEEIKERNQQKEISSLEEIRTYFMEYHENKRIAESFMDDPEDLPDLPDDTSKPENDDDLSYMESDPPKKDPPKHVQIVMKIMERCVHLLASPDARLRLLVLGTVTQCCLALHQHQDELLPIIHKVWPPFVQRFMDEEQLVIIKAFEVLKVMGDTTGDFIRQRVVKDVLPKVTSTLQRMSKSSMKTGPAYRHTMTCKLQLAVLQNIGSLCDQIGVAENHLYPVLKSVLPYLSCRQQPVLQEAAVLAFHYFATDNADSVWLMLTSIYCPKVPEPPHPCFNPVPVNSSLKRNEYSDNIMKIFEVL